MKTKPSTTYKSYVRDALRTESDHLAAFTRIAADPRKLRLLHAAMGIQTEGGELTDALKKHLFYGKNLDLVNLKEELGDLFWYIAILCDALGERNFTNIMQTNIKKLRTRYPEAFTEEKAENRDLGAERGVLEGLAYLDCSECGKTQPVANFGPYGKDAPFRFPVCLTCATFKEAPDFNHDGD